MPKIIKNSLSLSDSISLKKRAFNAGLTQQQIAERIGMSQPAVARFLNGYGSCPINIKLKIEEIIKKSEKAMKYKIKLMA